MYFDAVISEDRTVLFNGTPEETALWLKAEIAEFGRESVEGWTVYPGVTLRALNVSEYLSNQTY
jgi:hypothetical protein